MPEPKKKLAKMEVSLTEEERMLVTLREELYGGSWDRMLEDLNRRLNGKPYIFKLATRIEEDIQVLQRLRRLERRKGIDLAEHVRDEEF